MRIEEKTEYPFNDRIDFVFHCSKPQKKTFTFRIPVWCDKAEVRINGKDAGLKNTEKGKFTSIRRTFKEGDTVELVFDMPARMTCPAGQGISFEKGPLLFSYHIPTEWTVDDNVYPNMRGKVCGNPDFKCWSLTPAGKFNYGIDRFGFTEIRNDKAEGCYPFDVPPFKIRIQVREIDWPLVEGKYTPSIPTVKVKKLSKTEHEIDLVPYGCTQLRLTVFPQLSSKIRVEGLD